MTAFDVLVRGGTLVDGTGAPGRPADVGVLGDRVLAVGDLSAVAATDVRLVVDATSRVVAPGFIDLHGHSDATLFADGALASHLRQGFTTQLSGNCGIGVAPITPASRPFVDLELRPSDVVARWSTFPELLDAVDEVALGPNVAFLAAHGILRASVLGSDARDPSPDELGAIERLLADALEAGAFGLSSGLIYAPGMHARVPELAALARIVATRGALYATHIRNEAAGLLEALDEAVETARAAGDRARLQVSHLKVAARALHGRAADAVARLERARADGVDAAADQYPYTAASTTLQIVLPPALLALSTDETVTAISDVDTRERVRVEIAAGRTGWEHVATDPGWGAITVAFSPTHADWGGHSIAELAAELEREPIDVALDLLADDALDTAIVLDVGAEDDVRTILAVPWIAIGTDASGRRRGHRVLDAGVPHPRTYGTTARVLGRYVRDEAALGLETAVAKLTSVPADRLGLRDRGVVREGALADLVVFDPATVIDRATYADPAVYPDGIDEVLVNGRAAVLGGEETGERPGRLLRSSAR
jgi:N-acyl-D-amino-acid deacylase